MSKDNIIINVKNALDDRPSEILTPLEIRNYKIYYSFMSCLTSGLILPLIIYSNFTQINIIAMSICNPICIFCYNWYNYLMVISKGNILYHIGNEFIYVAFKSLYYFYLIFTYQEYDKNIQLILNITTLIILIIQSILGFKGRKFKTYLQYLSLLFPFIAILSTTLFLYQN